MLNERGRELHTIIRDIADRHDERIKNEPRYRMTFLQMKEATKPMEPSRHYDRDGYCDNPARGY
jgi:hypothetical protein